MAHEFLVKDIAFQAGLSAAHGRSRAHTNVRACGNRRNCVCAPPIRELGKTAGGRRNPGTQVWHRYRHGGPRPVHRHGARCVRERKPDIPADDLPLPLPFRRNDAAGRHCPVARPHTPARHRRRGAEGAGCGRDQRRRRAARTIRHPRGHAGHRSAQRAAHRLCRRGQQGSGRNRCLSDRRTFPRACRRTVLATLSSSRFRGEEEREIGFRRTLRDRYPSIGIVEISEGSRPRRCDGRSGNGSTFSPCRASTPSIRSAAAIVQCSQPLRKRTGHAPCSWPMISTAEISTCCAAEKSISSFIMT